MKKILLSVLSLFVTITMFAQGEAVRKMRVVYDGEVVYTRAISLIDSVKFVLEETEDEVIGGGEVDSSKQLYVGVVAFNQSVRQMNITSDIEAVKTFINEQTNDKDFTSFAYSVSKGNQMFDAETLPTFDKIFMLNFSDGTDNYSNMKWGEEGRMVAQRNVYDTAQYDLQQRVGLNSYALGFGNDVGFGTNMQKVVMGSGRYFNATSASELQSTFNEIAKSMLASAKNVLLKTNPGYYVGGECKYFRFTFTAEGGYTDTIYAQMDGYPAIGYTLSISKVAKNYAYFDAPAKGFVDEETGKVQIPLNNLKFVKDGEELQYKFAIEVSFDGELYYEDVEEASTAEEIDKRIAVVLVLDCSSSMGDAFAPMKAAAVDFIKTMEKMEVDDSEPNIPDVPNVPGTSIVFDADKIRGNAYTDSNNATAFQISQNGVTLDVSKGIIGTYNNDSHYRIYKNQTLTLTSTVGHIINVEFTCTANDNEQYGPGCFTVSDGSYSYADSIGTWKGNTSEIVFTALTNQVRATQIVVTINNSESSTMNNHEYVDLGLSVKWATCNVGATKPEEYGDYFAWGETEPKEVYDWSTYKYCNGSSSTLTKYNTDSSRGTVDNKTTLELSDDAARANWGGAWRLPTKEEQDELRENCTWTWTTENGVNGYRVTSNKEGYTDKSLFLPAAGCRYNSDLCYAGSDGNYWSSSLDTGSPYFAYYLYFDSSGVDWSGSDRYCGRSVRPVCP